MEKKENPFCLKNDHAYLSWRKNKLASSIVSKPKLFVEVKNLSEPTNAELTSIRDHCKKYNFSFYNTQKPVSTEQIICFAKSLGLQNSEKTVSSGGVNSVTELRVCLDGARQDYIPYSNRPLNWHTDGYYATKKNPVRSFLLHCVRQASVGGESSLIDPEVVYIRLRDLNPLYISSLMLEDAMTIPANTFDKSVLRPQITGPVFWIDQGTLRMRYTARKRNVLWKKDKTVQFATQALEKILNSDDPQIIVHRMEGGQGLICNNVLHKREGFLDSGAGRLMYRARFFDQIS